MEIRESNIVGAGQGMFAAELIEKGCKIAQDNSWLRAGAVAFFVQPPTMLSRMRIKSYYTEAMVVAHLLRSCRIIEYMLRNGKRSMSGLWR